MNHAEYDAGVAGLVGNQIVQVTYFEIEYEPKEPWYLLHPEIGHFLDYGVEWILTDGTYRSFIWDQAFFCYGVGLFATPMQEQVTTQRTWDVTAAPLWQPLIEQPITAAQTHWSWVQRDVYSERIYYPQDLSVQFANGQTIYICAAQYDTSSNRVIPMSDEILVVFSDEAARAHGLGPFAADE